MLPAAEIFPKACSDSNAAALDKALDAVVAFLSVASDQLAAKIARSTASSIVAKCLGARVSTQQKGIDVLLAFVEAEQADKAMVSSSMQWIVYHGHPNVCADFMTF